MLTQLALSDLQLRALNLGQDRFRRRLWILPHAGGVYLEALESSEGNAGHLKTWDGRSPPPIKKPRWDEDGVDEKEEEEVERKHQDEQQIEQEKPLKMEIKGTIVDKVYQQPVAEKQAASEIKSEPMDVAAPPPSTVSDETVEAAQQIKTEQAVADDPPQPTTTQADEPATIGAEDVALKSELMEETIHRSLPPLWFSLFPRCQCDNRSLNNPSGGGGGGDLLNGDGSDAGQGSEHVKEEADNEQLEKKEVHPIPEGKAL